jgi:putative FmdB family regulatory protein
MPIYTYRCEQCGEEVEMLVSHHEPHPTECPACGGTLRRTFSGSVGLVFKGSGFYITDYKKQNTSTSSSSSSDKGSKKNSASTS